MRKLDLAGFLLLLQHPKTFTFGRRDSSEHLLSSKDDLVAQGFELVQTDRGGLVTYHGPGQLVGYPILNLEKLNIRGAHEYVGKLERVLTSTLADFEVQASLYEGLRGVFVDQNKIAAIGVHLKKQVSRHGFALNVEPDLDHYRHITPCGLSAYGVTSLAELGAEVSMSEVVQSLSRHFNAIFEVQTEAIELEKFIEKEK